VAGEREAPSSSKRASVAFAVALVLVSVLLATRGAAERVAKVSRQAPDAVLIGAGTFDMGSDDADVAFAVSLCRAHASAPELCQPDAFADEQPRHAVRLAGYRLDRTEVSRVRYLACVAVGECAPPRTSEVDARIAQPDHPVTGVLAGEAAGYCARLGGRLPTEAEWERAARGSGGRRFPWGHYWNTRVSNHGERLAAGAAPHDGYAHAAPVDALPDGASAYGLLNMAGNVWELTADRYAADAYARSGRTDPRGPSDGDSQVIRGGGHASAPHELRVTARAALSTHEARADVGFRCAYDLPRAAPGAPAAVTAVPPSPAP
jgi:formylglycine-generating enzyme required for sulfatase activity